MGGPRPKGRVIQNKKDGRATGDGADARNVAETSGSSCTAVTWEAFGAGDIFFAKK